MNGPTSTREKEVGRTPEGATSVPDPFCRGVLISDWYMERGALTTNFVVSLYLLARIMFFGYCKVTKHKENRDKLKGGFDLL